MHFSFVFDSFPLFYAKRPNRSRRSLIFFKDQRYRFAPVGLWKMSIRSFSKSNRSQKTIDSIENPMIEFPTLPAYDSAAAGSSLSSLWHLNSYCRRTYVQTPQVLSGSRKFTDTLVKSVGENLINFIKKQKSSWNLFNKEPILQKCMTNSCLKHDFAWCETRNEVDEFFLL